MRRSLGRSPWIVVLFAVILAWGLTWAQEHPEHPTKQEHPKQKEPVTIESVAKFLEGHVESTARGGSFTVYDDKAGSDLELTLDKIHRERLAKTGARTYFVCADFKTSGGKLYDLDFWVKENDQGLLVTETTVHKEEGVARYNWVKEGGIWKKESL